MQKADIEGVTEHRRIHSEFIARLRTLTPPLDGATILWMKKWRVAMLHHITVAGPA